ncbi:methyltransferase domain-containing protein [Alteromonas macleodii]|uniref:methyltransferase domain-containing protein n=1 Tax=Alteromonas macleodii TaxID=28108 RepID=UPI0012835CA9|nr:methyltransferase domain-containing protein [Alteromonas macleodii]CAI2389458.1 malonyl-CoA O-methyltransferase [Alteromonas macleodii]CAI3945080.1 malonyl-CoA O-methyltransferase [Alteromonas macleodii]CAI3946041.1 malonyl-CoA O-methyltransferase [Alteromonas macleodii]CAI3946123.1 malonyl-CoA O-methyltransferase [Alteromonas macleodii]VTO39054.1 malonyl-CoA O-methyltransferase [Alteromonas macleodii]
MSLSPAVKAAMSAESRSLFDGKLSRDAAQAAFKANGAFSSETSFESERATNAKGTLTVKTAYPSDCSSKAAAHLNAEEKAKTEGYITAEGSITTKGAAKAERDDTASTINEQDVAHRFSKAAAQYNSIASVQRIIAKQAIKNLPIALQGKALDIGCGTGIHTQTLANKGAAATGVDIAEGMLAQARKMYSDPIFVEGSAVDLPFCDSQFSTVFSSMALQWVSDTRLVANEVARVLEKSGIAELAIMVAGSFSELKTARKVAQLPQAETYMPTTAQWVNGFKQSGLSLQRVITKDYVDTHCDIMSLLRSVKGVGAGETGQRQPPLTRRDLKKLAMAYSNMSSVESKLPLTYRVSHFRLEKR